MFLLLTSFSSGTWTTSCSGGRVKAAAAPNTIIEVFIVSSREGENERRRFLVEFLLERTKSIRFWQVWTLDNRPSVGKEKSGFSRSATSHLSVNVKTNQRKKISACRINACLCVHQMRKLSCERKRTITYTSIRDRDWLTVSTKMCTRLIESCQWASGLVSFSFSR